MSDTPRTNAAWNKLNRDDSTGYQMAIAMKIFAKQLERELAEERKQRNALAAAAKMFLGSKAPFPDPRPLRSAIAAVKGGNHE
jgi:hypothetical protein